MSLKMKLTSTIMAFMLLASMLIVGVFAVKKTEFSVGGNIVFNATGIDATISAGTLSTTGSWATGDGTGKMEEVVIDTDKSASDLATKYATWSDLDLAFNEAGDDVTITFTITNNSTNNDDSLVAYVNIDSGTSKNAVAYVENAGAVIAPNTTDAADENVEEFVITFKVLDKEVNASLESFKIDFDIRYATVEADSATETTLSYQGITYTIGENNTVSLTDGKSASINEVVVPAYIKSSENTYVVTSLGNTAFMNSGIISIAFSNTVTSLGNAVFGACTELKKINLTDSVLSIGGGAFFGTSITHITIPKNVTSLGYQTFQGANLISIDIPLKVESIAEECFSGCTSLKTINYQGTQEQWSAISIDASNDVIINSATINYNFSGF